MGALSVLDTAMDGRPGALRLDRPVENSGGSLERPTDDGVDAFANVDRASVRVDARGRFLSTGGSRKRGGEGTRGGERKVAMMFLSTMECLPFARR